MSLRLSLSQSFNVSTYLYSIKHDCYNIALAKFFTILDAFIVATMSQLAIIEGPTVVCVTESSFRVDI